MTIDYFAIHARYLEHRVKYQPIIVQFSPQAQVDTLSTFDPHGPIYTVPQTNRIILTTFLHQPDSTPDRMAPAYSTLSSMLLRLQRTSITNFQTTGSLFKIASPDQLFRLYTLTSTTRVSVMESRSVFSIFQNSLMNVHTGLATPCTRLVGRCTHGTV